ncbi:IS30 family transposase [Litoreibacter albidus]|uniref:IS30 family transposase n=1 Tax=Litoreibacter albidus TaxID=670155 RepID=UPI0037365709
MRRPYRKLTLDERRILATMLQAKATKTKIAEVLGRDRSTIHREIKRNWWHDEEVPQAAGYWHVTAQTLADRRYLKRRKLEQHEDLRNEVIGKLKTGWSPEQITGRLKIEPCAPYRICHETIYQYVYSESGQSQELGRYLPERRRKRKPRYARKVRDRVFPLETSIHNRPDEINDRSQFGNWEGDLMIFERAQGNANVATLIERKTRYTVLLRNNDRKSRPLMNKLVNEMSPLPADARRSITFDRGFEFTSWRELHKGMGTKSWFCDPQAPWQKGSVENMNKRVRRYLPRDTALLSLPNRYMKSICDRRNATPRKCLGYRTPAEAFRDELMKLEPR